MGRDPDDYRDILRHFLGWVREMDPAGYEKLISFAELETPDPRQALLNAIGAYGQSMSARGERSHSEILDRLNRSVSTEDGRPIEGVHVALSQAEQERYQREYLDLTPTSRYEAFSLALHDLYAIILEDQGPFYDKR